MVAHQIGLPVCCSRYTTTVVGAHSVPRWYEPLDQLVSLGQLPLGDFADAQMMVTKGYPVIEAVCTLLRLRCYRRGASDQGREAPDRGNQSAHTLRHLMLCALVQRSGPWRRDLARHHYKHF